LRVKLEGSGVKSMGLLLEEVDEGVLDLESLVSEVFVGLHELH
jgi:hypothetical protein